MLWFDWVVDVLSVESGCVKRSDVTADVCCRLVILNTVSPLHRRESGSLLYSSGVSLKTFSVQKRVV